MWECVDCGVMCDGAQPETSQSIEDPLKELRFTSFGVKPRCDNLKLYDCWESQLADHRWSWRRQYYICTSKSSVVLTGVAQALASLQSVIVTRSRTTHYGQQEFLVETKDSTALESLQACLGPGFTIRDSHGCVV